MLLPCLALLAACGAGREGGARVPADGGAASASTVPVERAWPVMGTMLSVAAWDDDAERAVAVLRTVRAAVNRVDSLMSTYRDDSDVSRINRAAGSGAWTRVSAETLEVLEASLEHARRSEGAFDPTVGPVIDVWGFYRETGAIPGAGALDSARALTGWRRVEVRREDRLVRLPAAGMRLDFGAIAKGYAVDLAVAAAERAGGRRVMIDLGGNIGVLGDAPAGGRWPLGLRHPRDPALPFAVIDVEHGAVATSGDYERFFVIDGTRYAHIVDPRTGWPVRGVASVSVLAPTGMESDALSTALFVMGPVAGCAAIAAAPGVAAVWVLAPAMDAVQERLRVIVGGGLASRVEVADEVDVEICPGAGG